MANFRAIDAVTRGITRLLEAAYLPAEFNNQAATFAVYLTDSFSSPMNFGVSLFLYHVSINTTRRVIPVSNDPITGKPRRPQLPLDLHFILTPWATEASNQHQILAWAMRVLEDNPTLGSQALNAHVAAGFEEDESVEIVAGQMTNTDMFEIWDVLPGDFQLSVPYIARIVRIDSFQPLEGRGIVTVRELDFGRSARS